MKFNVQVELDWVGEDAVIDEVLQNKIVSKVSEMILSNLKKDVADKLSKKASDSFDLKINELPQYTRSGKIVWVISWNY